MIKNSYYFLIVMIMLHYSGLLSMEYPKGLYEREISKIVLRQETQEEPAMMLPGPAYERIIDYLKPDINLTSQKRAEVLQRIPLPQETITSLPDNVNYVSYEPDGRIYLSVYDKDHKAITSSFTYNMDAQSWGPTPPIKYNPDRKEVASTYNVRSYTRALPVMGIAHQFKLSYNPCHSIMAESQVGRTYNQTLAIKDYETREIIHKVNVTGAQHAFSADGNYIAALGNIFCTTKKLKTKEHEYITTNVYQQALVITDLRLLLSIKKALETKDFTVQQTWALNRIAQDVTSNKRKSE